VYIIYNYLGVVPFKTNSLFDMWQQSHYAFYDLIWDNSEKYLITYYNRIKLLVYEHYKCNNHISFFRKCTYVIYSTRFLFHYIVDVITYCILRQCMLKDKNLSEFMSMQLCNIMMYITSLYITMVFSY